MPARTRSTNVRAQLRARVKIAADSPYEVRSASSISCPSSTIKGTPSGPGSAGRRHRTLDVGPGAASDAAQFLAGAGVEIGRLIVGVDPVAVDQQLPAAGGELTSGICEHQLFSSMSAR